MSDAEIALNLLRRAIAREHLNGTYLLDKIVRTHEERDLIKRLLVSTSVMS